MPNLYFSELDSRYMSAGLWSGIDLDNLLRSTDRRRGFAMFDDFTNFAGILASTDGRFTSEGNSYLSQQTSTCTITNVALSSAATTTSPIHLGAIALATNNTDGDTCGLHWGGHLVSPYGCFPFAVIPGISGDLVFECRIKLPTLVVTGTTGGSIYVGLAGAAGVLPIAADVPITNSDAWVTTLSVLGFTRLLAATTGAFTASYGRAGVTPTATATVATVVADTYIKMGFRYHSDTSTLSTWVNGVKTSVGVANTITDASPWPNDYMAPIIVTEAAGTTTQGAVMDWWGCAQLPPIKPATV